MRFYQYLALTPVPKIAYEGPDFVPLQQLQVLSTATKGDKERLLIDANDALKRAMFSFRLTPWKNFFCHTLHSSPLCVPECVLLLIAQKTLPIITEKDLKVVTPPPVPIPFPWFGSRMCIYPPSNTIGPC
jgi:hypothetical protein